MIVSMIKKETRQALTNNKFLHKNENPMLKTLICPWGWEDPRPLFISNHWNYLSQCNTFKKVTWKKALLDAFSHSPMIESGKEKLNQRGMYKLKLSKHKPFTHNEMNYQPLKLDPSLQILWEYQIEKKLGLMTIKDEMNYCLDALKDQLIHSHSLLMNIQSKTANSSIQQLIEMNSNHFNSISNLIKTPLSPRYQ